LHPLENNNDRLTPYLRESAIETEQKIAALHVLIGVFGCIVSVLLVVNDMLPLQMAPLLYLGILFFFLVYALVYHLWAPWHRYPLTVTAGSLVVLDLLVATVIMINTGGLASSFWGLWAAAALSYGLRFRYGWREMTVTAALFLVTIWTVAQVAPTQIISAHGNIVGFAFSLLGILGIGRILVNSERQAIRDGIAAEDETIHRIINTVQHEVNNPLTIATGNLEMLKMEEACDSMAELDRIEEALERIGKAVNHLRDLEFNRSVSGEGLMERYPLHEEQAQLDAAEEE